MRPVLRIKDLTVDIGTKRVIDGVCLELCQGRILALVGESGSGKTLTALSILDLLPSQARRVSGEILFEGRDVLKLSSEEKRYFRGGKTAMAFQEPFSALNPLIRAGEQIMETMLAHGIEKSPAEKKMNELLDLVRLPKYIAGRYPHELSGGQRQRVMLAIALSCEPDLLILDEPTTALDVSVQKHILDLVLGLRREKGFATIFITHDFSVVSMIGDDVAVMRSGVLVETGSREKVLRMPGHEYTRKLIGCIPRLGEKRDRLPV